MNDGVESHLHITYEFGDVTLVQQLDTSQTKFIWKLWQLRLIILRGPCPFFYPCKFVSEQYLSGTLEQFYETLHKYRFMLKLQSKNSEHFENLQIKSKFCQKSETGFAEDKQMDWSKIRFSKIAYLIHTSCASVFTLFSSIFKMDSFLIFLFSKNPRNSSSILF